MSGIRKISSWRFFQHRSASGGSVRWRLPPARDIEVFCDMRVDHAIPSPPAPSTSQGQVVRFAQIDVLYATATRLAADVGHQRDRRRGRKRTGADRVHRRPNPLANSSGGIEPTYVHPAQNLTLPATCWLPAAMERVIDAHIAENLKCRVLAERRQTDRPRRTADLVLEKRQDEIFLIPTSSAIPAASVVSYSSGCRICSSCFWKTEEEVMRARIPRSSIAPSTKCGPREKADQISASHRRDGDRRWKRSAPRRPREGCFP